MDDIAKRPPSTLSAYLALVRPPNITTALADVLAGYGVAGLGNAAALPWLLVATACLYGGGVALNDFFDRRLDQIERPERPIPSGRVPAAIAGSIGSLLLVAGVAAASCASNAAGLIALAIAGLAVIYDAWAKHRRGHRSGDDGELSRTQPAAGRRRDAGDGGDRLAGRAAALRVHRRRSPRSAAVRSMAAAARWRRFR